MNHANVETLSQLGNGFQGARKMELINELCNVQAVRAATSARSLLSLREATVLANVSEARVRKDIETGVLAAPYIIRIGNAHLRTHWSFVFTLGAIYGNSYLNGKLRKHVLNEVVRSRHLADSGIFNADHICSLVGETSKDVEQVSSLFASCSVALDRFIFLDFGSVVKEISPKVSFYIKGLLKTEEKDGILGGEAVFKGTRLPVAHIGKAFNRGETMDNLLEDYPYLTEGDVRFAEIYHLARPSVGRPQSVLGDIE